MKKTITTIILFAIGSTLSLSSCVKTYDCMCTDTWGNKTKEVVNATNKVQARKNCNDLDIRRNCDLE